jgi:hypothetical protein
MNALLFRLHYWRLGGHTHVTVYVGPRKGTLAKCGNLIVSNEEFSVLADALTTPGSMFEFVDDEVDAEKEQPR